MLPKQRQIVQQNLLSRRLRNRILVLGTVMIRQLRPYRSESFKATVVFFVADCFVVLTLFIYLFINLFIIKLARLRSLSSWKILSRR